VWFKSELGYCEEYNTSAYIFVVNCADAPTEEREERDVDQRRRQTRVFFIQS
jgi:hypothetical protein